VEVHLLPAGEALLERIAGLHQNELQRLLKVFALTGN
jgi:hypothetical protein